MKRQRLQNIESLQISNGSVKCQRCDNSAPIVGKLSRPHNDRVAILQERIKWIENYSRGNTNRSSYIDDLKALKQELAELLEEDTKADKLRNLPYRKLEESGRQDNTEVDIELPDDTLEFLREFYNNHIK